MMPKRKPTPPQIPDARAIFKRVDKIAMDTLADELEHWAGDIRDEFVMRIEQQAFASFQEVFYPESGTNLSPRWLHIKELANADLRTMIATGHYIESIQVFRTFDRRQKKYVIRVGFHPSAKPRNLQGRTVEIEIPGTGITGLTALAIVQELGSLKAGIPARPHWRPHREKVAKDARKKRKEFRRTISEAIRSDKTIGDKLAVGVRG